MKYIFLFLSCFCHFEIKAQTDSINITKHNKQLENNSTSTAEDINYDYYNSYTRAIIVLKDHSVLHVEQITTHNNDVMVEYKKNKIPLHPIYNLRIENIKYITFKRGTFVKGMLAGSFLGLLIAGFYAKSAEDNSIRIRRSLYVTLGIIPLGLTGGIIGSIFIKKRFMINGDREKMNNIIRHM